MFRAPRSRWLAGAAALAMAAGACGSSTSKSSTPVTTAATQAGVGAGAGGASCAPDTSLDAADGQYAGWMQAVLQCTTSHPLKATGAPITIGFLNPQGDPNGSFPDATAGAKAAIAYINDELGGLGGNPLKGVAGRPLKLATCFETISPSSSTSCANQIAAAKPLFIISGYQFFGEAVDPIFKAANIPVVYFNPITLADFDSPDVYDIAAGGGCVGVHPALIHFAVYDLHAKNLAIPWSNTPPGVVCYYDLEQKPVQVVNGSLTPTPPGVQLVPGTVEHGYPIAPASPDVSSQAAQILAQKPDAIIFSAQASDCFNVLNGLSTLGWTAKKIPLIFSGSCLDTAQIKQAGAKVDGVYFVGATYNLLDPTSATGLASQEIKVIDSRTKQYEPSQTPTGIEASMFQTILTSWLDLDNSSSASSLTPASINSTFTASSKVHMFAGVPWGCSAAPKNYSSVCSTAVSVLQWNGTAFVSATQPFDASYLVSGTPIHATGQG